MDNRYWSAVRNAGSSSNVAANASAMRTEIPYDDLSVSNVAFATTLSLLRERERYLSAIYQRMARCLDDGKVLEFSQQSKEGPYDDTTRKRNLKDVVCYLTRRIEELRGEINGKPDAKRALKKASSSGGILVKKMRERSKAIATELAKREFEEVVNDVLAEANNMEVAEANSNSALTCAFPGTAGASKGSNANSATKSMQQFCMSQDNRR